jgi:hypothetical protein
MSVPTPAITSNTASTASNSRTREAVGRSSLTRIDSSARGAGCLNGATGGRVTIVLTLSSRPMRGRGLISSTAQGTTMSPNRSLGTAHHGYGQLDRAEKGGVHTSSAFGRVFFHPPRVPLRAFGLYTLGSPSRRQTDWLFRRSLPYLYDVAEMRHGYLPIGVDQRASRRGSARVQDDLHRRASLETAR